MVQQYVVDASVLIQGYVREVHTNRVRTVLSQALTAEPVELHVPEFGLLECTNIFWKRVSFHGTSLAEVEQALADLIAFPLIVGPTFDLLPRALTIGVTHQLAIYDSVYIALAEKLACPLITVDERQAKVAAAVGVTLKPITDFAEFIS